MAENLDIELHAVVISQRAIREFDKRLTLLSNEYGKITVWASNAKKAGSPYMAGTRNFVFGTFTVRKGKKGYNLHHVKVKEYFQEIALDLQNACYGSYFLELIDSVLQEGEAMEDMVNLLYLSLKAILNMQIPNELVRRIFELRLLLANGEYTELPPLESSEACSYTWRYILTSPLQKLFTFNLKEEVLRELSQNIDLLMRELVPYEMKSLEVLKRL